MKRRAGSRERSCYSGRVSDVAPSPRVEGPGAGLRSRLRGLLVSQFFGAFNDNAWRVIVTFLAIDALGEQLTPAAAQSRTTLATVALTVPLILFSLPAGLLNDRISKQRVILWLKGVEVALMATGAWALYADASGGRLALVVLAAMGAHSALFSPAKYGILPELLRHEQLSPGNAVLEMWSTIAIIAGTASAGVLLTVAGPSPWLAGIVLVAFALVGLLAARTIPHVPAARAEGGMLRTIRTGWAAMRQDRILWLAVLGSVFFWFVASVFFQVVVVYGKSRLLLDNTGASAFLGVLMVGIAAGSLLAGRISGGRVEYGLIPLGAVGLAALTLAFAWIGPGLVVANVLMFAMGLAGGLVNVPLNALKQWRAPDDLRGSVLALGNILVYTGILVGSLATGQAAAVGLSSEGILAATGVLIAGGTIWALWLLPDAFIRLVLVITTSTVYRMRVMGGDRIPVRGGALLVANHVSFVDAFLLLAATDRPIRFLADVSYYEHPLLSPFMRSLGAIPISSASGPKALLRSMQRAGEAIDRGDLVCVFPEGQITRTGLLLPFQRGFERIVKGRDAPVIPVHLDRVWGSIFSRSGGRFFSKLPSRIPYPVTVAIGEPLPDEAPIHEVRQRVRELGTDAWQTQVADALPLHHSFVRRFRKAPWRFAFADQGRPHVSRFKALVGAIALGRALREHWEGQRNVGILLPSTVGGALVNIAAALAGKVSVNLNFTAGRRAMESAARQAELETVVTSGLFVAKAELELPEGVEPIWIEEVAETVGGGARVAAMLLAVAAPVRWIERACGAERPARPTDLLTIIFSSGSTGEPKGVPLTHFNLDTNVRGSLQVLLLDRRDRLLGSLPLFHSFGYMACLWMVVHAGIPVVYHPSPLDTEAIGKLVRKYRLTIMFSTPTFLQLYTRRVAPALFGSLRLVITGAEKLPRAVARSFRDSFGLEPLEGYGVTETSPVISVNVPDFRAAGIYQPGWRRGTVGQPVPGVSVRIRDLDTGESLGPDEEGMIVVRGPNVMQGYLDRPDLTDEVLHDGWYTTGDIGALDVDGFLRITDRYSRFSKIGGEMVPHGVVEEALHKAAGSEERLFFVGSADDPRKGERLVVLYTTEPEAIPEILERIGALGLPNLFVPRKDDFFRVEAIPVLGSGKTDLKAAKEMARRLYAEKLGSRP